jgi:hypothetical protein
MILKPCIASYSGQSYRAIKQFLDQRALNLITQVSSSPLDCSEVDAGMISELIEMHVLASQGGNVRLDTAVFLEEDIRSFAPFIEDYSRGLVEQIAGCVSPLYGEQPQVITFLVGIIGIGQSLGHALREKGIVVDWRNYGGKYAQSKVDFDEVCEANTAAGEDLLNKTILRGNEYTAVFIGPGGLSYPVNTGGTGDLEYIHRLNVFLTDAYALLLLGKLENPALRSCAEQVDLIKNGLPNAPVISEEDMDIFLPTIKKLEEIVKEYFDERLSEIQSLLRSTRCGKQGVPVENMLMHFWRTMRKGFAKQLYGKGLFNDQIPEQGLITVFYENSIEKQYDFFS